MSVKEIHSKPVDGPEAAQITAAIVALGLHYMGTTTLGAEMLGASWCALLLPVVMMGLRVVRTMTGGKDEA